MINSYKYATAWPSYNNLLDWLLSSYGMDSNVTDSHGSRDWTNTNWTWNTTDYVLGTASWEWDGSWDYITFSNDTLGEWDFMISVWFKTDVVTSQNKVILNTRDPLNSYAGLQISRTNNIISCALDTWPAYIKIELTQTVSASTWYHLVYYRDWDTVGAVLNNGTIETNTWATWDLSGTSDKYFSRSTNWQAAYSWDWLIDQPQFWNRAPATWDIEALYNDWNWLAYSEFDSGS